MKILCLCLLLSIAVVMDLKSFKISNKLIFIGFLLGFSFRVYEKSWTSLLDGLIGVLLPIIILWPLFRFKALGAGDIKLYSLIGLFFDSYFLMKNMLYSLFVAGFLSIIYLLKSKQFLKRFSYLITYIQSYYSNSDSKGIKAYYDRKVHKNAGVIHYSVAILIAVLYQVYKMFLY